MAGLLRGIRGLFPSASVATRGGPELAAAGGPLLATPAPSRGYAAGQLAVALLPLLFFLGVAWFGWQLSARPVAGPLGLTSNRSANRVPSSLSPGGTVTDACW